MPRYRMTLTIETNECPSLAEVDSNFNNLLSDSPLVRVYWLEKSITEVEPEFETVLLPPLIDDEDGSSDLHPE